MEGIANYVFGEIIGRGTFCVVRLATDKQSKQSCVVKIVDRAKLIEESHIQHMECEIQALSRLSHKGIVRLIDFREDKDYGYIFEEKCVGKSLFDIIMDPEYTADEQFIKSIFRQLIEVIEYIHSKNICHRDIKPENIIVDESNNLKLIDFGFCVFEADTNSIKNKLGSLHYAAPECFQANPYFGKPADIWATGIILFALWTRHLPWSDTTPQGVVGQIVHCQYEIPNVIPNQCAELLRKILIADPSRRPTAQQVLRMQWIQIPLPRLKAGKTFLIHSAVYKAPLPNTNGSKKIRTSSFSRPPPDDKEPQCMQCFRAAKGIESMNKRRRAASVRYYQ